MGLGWGIVVQQYFPTRNFSHCRLVTSQPLDTSIRFWDFRWWFQSTVLAW